MGNETFYGDGPSALAVPHSQIKVDNKKTSETSAPIVLHSRSQKITLMAVVTHQAFRMSSAHSFRLLFCM